MSLILYYSNYCEPSKKLLGKISRSQIKEELHFICIDKREVGSHGKTVVLLENGQKIGTFFACFLNKSSSVTIIHMIVMHFCTLFCWKTLVL